MGVGEVLRLHGVAVTACKIAVGVYAWQVVCGSRKGKGEIRLRMGRLRGANPTALGLACMERLAEVAHLVEAHLSTGRPDWLPERDWGTCCDMAEELRRAAPPRVYLALVHAEEHGIPLAAKSEFPTD